MEYKKKEEIIKQFYKKCLPILAFYEQERKRKLRTLFIIGPVLIMVAVLYFCNIGVVESFFESFNFVNPSEWYELSVGLMLVYSVVVFAYFYCVIMGIKLELKEIIMPRIMKSFEYMHHATKKDIFSKNELMESTLFGNFDKIEADDSFCGTFDGVNFKIMEAFLDVGDSFGVINSFKGVIVSFDSNKKINAKTTIITSNDINVKNNVSSILIGFCFLPLLPIMYYIIKGESIATSYDFFILSLSILILVFTVLFCVFIFNKKRFKDVYNQNNKEISLEDIKFAKRFKVFSEDEVEARYLITPSFMERFLSLTTSFGSNKAKCAFYNNKIMFAISTRKNLFEFGSLFKPLDNPKNIGFFNEIFSILDMIDYFKFDEKTGL